MTKYTSVYKLPSPELVEAADGPLGFSNLASAVETALLQVRRGVGIARYRINDFNVANGATAIAITLDGSSYASGMTYATGGKPIIPVAGRYLCQASLSYAPAAGGERLIAISQNGAAISNASTINAYASAAHSATLEVAYIGTFSVNAQIGLLTWQSSGKTLLCTNARLTVDLIAQT